MKPNLKLKLHEALAAKKHVVVTKSGRWLGAYDTGDEALRVAIADEACNNHRIYSPHKTLPHGKHSVATLKKSDGDNHRYEGAC
jgi:hypothetical protein